MSLKLPPATNNLVNYDFTDFLSQVSTITLYGFYSVTDYTALSRQTIASQTPIISTAIDSTDFTNITDLDMDYPINAACIVAGSALYVSVTVEDTASSNAAMECRLVVNVYHVNAAGTETSIGATATPTAAAIAANVTKSARLTTKVTLTEKKFIPGEKLRVNIIPQARRTGAGSSATWRLWIDAANRGTSVNNQVDPSSTGSDLGYKNSTNVVVEVPFKIRL